MLSAVIGIEIWEIECAVRPSSKRTAANADAATAMIFCYRWRRKSKKICATKVSLYLENLGRIRAIQQWTTHLG